MKDEPQVQWDGVVENHIISASKQLVALDRASELESMLDLLASRVAEKMRAPSVQVASMTFAELFVLYYERHAKNS